MVDNIDYRLYTLGDEYGILDLLKVTKSPVWLKSKDALRLWTWKYLESPLKSAIQVVKDGDRIVGVNHEVAVHLKIGNITHLAFYADDAAVHPDYRSRGIYSRMLKDSMVIKKERGVGFCYYATSNPIISRIDKQHGYRRFPHNLSHLVKISKSDQYAKKHERDELVTKLGIKVLTGYSHIRYAFSPRPKVVKDYSITEVTSFDERVNTLWEEVKGSYDFIMEKTLDYLNWKIRRPGTINVVRLAAKGSRVLGYIVLSLEKDGDSMEGSISDLLVHPQRLDVADELIRNACDFFVGEGATAIYYPVTKGHLYEILAKRYSFIDASQLKTNFFEYIVLSNEIDESYIENLSPSRVQLQYF